MSEDKNSALLTYCNRLYQRELASIQKSGITSWGLGIAFVYIVWKLIPHAFNWINDNNFAPSVSVLFSYMFFSFYFLCIGLQQNEPVISKFDLRIRKIKPSTSHMAFLLILLLCAPIMNLFFLDYSSLLLPKAGLLLIVNGAAASIIVLFVILFFFLGYVSTQNQLSAATFIQGAVVGNKFSYVTNLVFIILGTCNFIYLFWQITSLDLSIIKETLSCAFNLFILFLITLILLIQNTNKKSLELINSLERDIIFHNIDFDQAKEVLNAHYLGTYLGDFLQETLDNLKNEHKELCQKLEKTSSLVAEIKQLEPEFKFEKEGRIKSYISDIEKRFENYRSQIKPLLNWLNSKIKQHSRDDHLKEIIEPIIEDLIEDYSPISLKFKESKELLENLI